MITTPLKDLLDYYAEPQTKPIPASKSDELCPLDGNVVVEALQRAALAAFPQSWDVTIDLIGPATPLRFHIYRSYRENYCLDLKMENSQFYWYIFSIGTKWETSLHFDDFRKAIWILRWRHIKHLVRTLTEENK